MQESYGKGVATHTGPESCAVTRKGEGEALTGGRAGQVLSRERTSLRGADAVKESGRPHRLSRYRERQADPARSETLCTLEYTMPGNREVLELSAGDGTADRVGKPKGVRR